MIRSQANRSAWLDLILLLLALAFVGGRAVGDTPPELPLTAPWRQAVWNFTVAKLQHSAWGVAHSKRDYFSSLELARAEGLKVDEEVLFAAAMLHDMGGFDEFQKEGVDHAVRSAELVEGILKPTGFPMEKLPAVKEAILAHTYYNPKPPTTNEGQVLHDADTLDFLGAIGVARILSLTEREAVAKDLPAGVKLLRSFARTLVSRLHGAKAKELGQSRAVEMTAFLDQLIAQSYAGTSL